MNKSIDVLQWEEKNITRFYPHKYDARLSPKNKTSHDSNTPSTRPERTHIGTCPPFNMLPHLCCRLPSSPS